MSIPLEIIYGVGALVLLAGMAYAAIRYKTRNKALDPLTEAATRRNYETLTRDDVDEPPAPDERLAR